MNRKTILVTGGSGDLGQIVVPRLARDYRIIAPYRSESARQKLQHDDVVPVDSLNAVGSHAPLYALVHLAGGFMTGDSVERFQQLLDMNLLSTVHAVQAALPHFMNGGRIIAISAAASLTRPAGLGAYNASKAALNAYIETLAKDLKTRQITANALVPTTLDSPANQKDMPEQRLVKRANVAEMIALLLSDQAATITGQLIGMSA